MKGGSGLPSEELFSAVCGPPISKTTSSVTQDVGIYSHELYPTHSIRGLVKKSAVPPNCLVVSETHIFAAQHEKAQVQLYSRVRGQPEPPMHFTQRIRSLALQGDVLLLGTEEGGLLLWEVRNLVLRRSTLTASTIC